MKAPALLKRLALVVGVLYLALAYVAYFRLGALTGDLKIMDLRITGYDQTDVIAYAKALGATGRDLYRETYLLLDWVFIFGLTSFLLALAYRFRSRVLAWIGALGAVGYVAFDISENLKVLNLFSVREAMITVAQVEAASFSTQCKFASLVIAAVCLFSVWRQDARSEE